MEKQKEIINLEIGMELIDRRDNKQAFISDMTNSSIEVFKFDFKFYHSTNNTVFKKWYSFDYFNEYFQIK